MRGGKVGGRAMGGGVGGGGRGWKWKRGIVRGSGGRVRGQRGGGDMGKEKVNKKGNYREVGGGGEASEEVRGQGEE